jgi:hypothetical protein
MLPTVCEPRAFLAQRQMRTALVLVAGVSSEDATQVRLAEHDDVVDAFVRIKPTSSSAKNPNDVSRAW